MNEIQEKKDPMQGVMKALLSGIHNSMDTQKKSLEVCKEALTAIKYLKDVDQINQLAEKALNELKAIERESRERPLELE